MSLAAVADVHAGNHALHGGPLDAGVNNRLKLVLRALRHALDGAHQRGCEDFVVLGDLFDVHRPSPQVVAAVGRTLLSFTGRVHLLRGNHDASTSAPGDDALAPLALLHNVSVYDQPSTFPIDGAPVLMVPHQVGPAHQWIESAIDQASLGNMQGGLLCVHLGLRDEHSGKGHDWAAQAEDAVDVSLLAELCAARGITQVLAGNWHTARDWTINGVHLRQVGALAPTGFDNPGLVEYGRVSLPHGDAFVVPGPRFLVSSIKELVLNAGVIRKEELAGCSIFVRVDCEASEVADTAEEAAQLAEDLGLAGWQVLPSKHEAKLRALASAAMARSAETFDDALGAFVTEKFKDKTEAHRARVLREVKGCLAKEGARG